MTIPDGTKVIVQNKGTVILENGIVLHNVLFAPSFKYNLISVNKISIDLNCKVFFNAYSCFVQDTLMKKPWLLGREKNGLYVIQEGGITSRHETSVQ